MEIIEDDQISALREKRRISFQANRLKKRSDAYNVRRRNINDITHKLQVPSLKEMETLTKKFIKEKHFDTLCRIRLGLSMGEEYIKVFMDVPSSLYTVIGSFTGKNAELQSEAGFTLINLGLGSLDQSYEVAVKVGAYLITMMGSSNNLLQDISAWCYGNLCSGNVQVCTLAQCQGIEVALVKLLDSYSPEVLQSSTFALYQYFTTVPHNISKVMNSGTLKVLVNSLERSDSAVTEVSWLLFLISTNEELCKYLVDYGVIQVSFNTLQQLINKQVLNVGAATALVRIVSNCIATVSPTAVEVCYRSDQLVSICSNLLYSPHPHHRKETLQLIANIYNTLTNSNTGLDLLDDIGLKLRLKSALKSTLASNFDVSINK